MRRANTLIFFTSGIYANRLQSLATIQSELREPIVAKRRTDNLIGNTGSPTGIRDVAREAGVSVASVSRALNRPDLLSDKALSRVQEAIERLNYIPNSAARALSLQRMNTIGAVIPTLGHSIFDAFMGAYQSRAEALGYRVVLATTDFDRGNELAQVRNLLGYGIEGFLLSGERHKPELHRLLSARGVPYVHTDVFNPTSEHPTVGYDNRLATRRATEHLLNLGHRRIAALPGVQETNDRMVYRVAGIRDALEARGLELPEDLIVERKYSIAHARDGARELLSRRPRPTAIICGHDVLAFGTILEAQELGLKIPEDLSVIGFDDVEFAGHVSPSLTTVHVPVEDMGERAAEHLIAQLSGQSTPRHVRVEVNLVVRDSTGPAPTA